MFEKTTIPNSEEFRRIRGLPRRPLDGSAYVEEYTQRLRAPGGTQTLRPAQALALHDVTRARGLFGNLRVGGGKTLITLLASGLLEAKRPVLFVPASLVQTTHDRMRALRAHWQVPRNIRVLSYEGLGRVSAVKELDLYRPDVLICDEVHRLKNLDAAVTRRVARYMYTHQETIFIGVSGTIMKRSILDFAHIIKWALREKAPLPLERDELELWSRALDSGVEVFNSVHPGPLGATQEQARAWFRERLEQTEGVVTTQGEQVAASLYVSGVTYSVASATDENFKGLRKLAQTPCGYGLSQPTLIKACARELALGLHYVRLDEPKFRAWQHKAKRLTTSDFDIKSSSPSISHLSGNSAKPVQSASNANPFAWITATSPEGSGDYSADLVTPLSDNSETVSEDFTQLPDTFEDMRPPKPWLEARKNWAAFVRQVLSRSRSLDSEEAVKLACLRGELDRRALDAWMLIEPTCKVISIPVWHDSAALNVCKTWMKRPGIVWVEHVYFGAKLARLTGAPYFGPKGLDAQGKSIEKETGKRAVIASISANREGKDLQMFDRNLITALPSADWLEQLIGRTHRDGQQSDAVTVEILLGCLEHWTDYERVLEDARYAESLGAPQKILLADRTVEDPRAEGYRWSEPCPDSVQEILGL